MTILVTGANGQLGNEMRIVARESGDNYIFTDVVAPEGVPTGILDITDIEAIRKLVRDNGVDIIVNCAAYTNQMLSWLKSSMPEPRAFWQKS